MLESSLYSFLFVDMITHHEQKQLVEGRIHFCLMIHPLRDTWEEATGSRSKKLRDFYPPAGKRECKLTVGKDCAVHLT